MRYFSILFICLLTACYNPKYTGSFDGLERVIEMAKGPCMGKCPVYFLFIYENGLAMYKGRANVEMIGRYYTVLPRKDFKAIKEVFAKANLTQYQDHYQAEVTDMPSTRISYKSESIDKTIRGDGKFSSRSFGLTSAIIRFD